ncbi:MAG TPA: molybdenum cofactor biosynthesis protein MoaE [Myxococcota bacterium]|nr:molybdenum cofactor biosynthesis protein MoaE [Myxococcota bacterium]
MLELTAEALDVAAIRARVDDPGFGAVLVFEGVVRNNFDGRPVTGLVYEAYEELASPVVSAIRGEITARWPGTRVAVAHRTGPLVIGETSMVIAVGTPHRAACFEASRYAIEAIKDRLPVWKKEVYADGEAWKPNPEV